jgi:GNAT superfamily N-acetyltransferase
VVVRDATRGDWPSIWPFFEQIVRSAETIPYDPRMDEATAREMWMSAPPGRTSAAADERGAVRGSAHMHPNYAGPGAHIASATYLVDPAHQGRGVGRALVEDSLEWARQGGFRGMQFNAVVATNSPALALYESLGFGIVGTVPGAFVHPRHGPVAMHVMFVEL